MRALDLTAPFTLNTTGGNVFGATYLIPPAGTYTAVWSLFFTTGIQPMVVACQLSTTGTVTGLSAPSTRPPTPVAA